MSKKKCPICGAEMKIDTSAVCTSIPPKYRCVCPSCNCLDFIKTSEYDQYKEEPSLPSNLDEAAEEFAYTNWESDDYHKGASDGLPFDAIGHTAKCFIAGAEWQKEQIMKEAEECFVEWYDGLYLNLTTEQMSNAIERAGAKVGDKVKVIVIKED